jgi:nitrogen fixation NifU-like protein
MNMDDIYLEHILDHFKSPRNYGILEDANYVYEGGNPTCGDMVKFFVKVSDGKIEDIRFIGKGCAISQASASILTELVKGKDLEFVKNMTKEQLLDELGIELSPTRLKCALLSIETLKIALFGGLS